MIVEEAYVIGKKLLLSVVMAKKKKEIVFLVLYIRLILFLVPFITELALLVS